MVLIVEYLLLPEAEASAFATCDVETAKILNLIAILWIADYFLNFFKKCMMKTQAWRKEITDRDLNVFFSDKALQSDVVAGWTDTAVRKLKQCFTRMMFEAGLLESSAKPRTIKPIHIDYRTDGIADCK
ncbi:MAG: BrxA family protein [Coprococcus sp.]